ncbi:MAG: PHP domain-containing protein [Anaerolineae bacterium]|nr:PHP domain-containing protein [Gemmatimonadaceae bacterium]
MPSESGSRRARYIDLHLHSTASDGTHTPAAVVAAARAADLTAVALTDHDSLAGVPEAREAGTALGIRVVCGVELSATEGERETHVLGLHLSNPSEIESHLATFRASRRDRAERIVQTLNGIGVYLSFESVLEVANGGAIGRPHIAKAMVASGWARDVRDAFDRYLGNGRPAFIPKYRFGISDSIQLIHRAGGLAFLAHPGVDGTRARLETLAAMGLDGVEVRHPGHHAHDTARLATLTSHFGLLATGGSDWHGSAEGPRALGCMRVPYEWLERHDERLEEACRQGRVA